MLRSSPGLVRASLEARTAAALPVLLDHPSRLAPLAPQDDVVICACPAGKYDFSKAERGRFYRPDAVLTPPVHLDADVLAFLAARAAARAS